MIYLYRYCIPLLLYFFYNFFANFCFASVAITLLFVEYREYLLSCEKSMQGEAA